MNKPKYIERVCKHHGLTVYILQNRGAYRCKKCISVATSKRRKKLKQLGVEFLGGRCIRCGYNKCIDALDFHHPNDDKSFGIADKGVTRSWKKLKEELTKCILLCANCHREEHSNNTAV